MSEAQAIVARAFKGDGKRAVAALIDAGIPEDILRSECVRAVIIAQQLPATVRAYKALAARAKAARKALNTIRAFTKELHDGPEGPSRPEGERDQMLRTMEEWEWGLITDYETVDLVEFSVHRQVNEPKAAPRVAVGNLSMRLRWWAQGEPNNERVATLAMALFNNKTITADDVRRWRDSVEELPPPQFDRWVDAG